MNLSTFEKSVRAHMLRRCRDHLLLMEKFQGQRIKFNYRYEHTKTAVAIATDLAANMGVDPILARIATWLHDLGKCWDPTFNADKNQERSNDHGKVGAEEAAAFLQSISFPQEKVYLIKQAIASHVGLVKEYVLEEPLAALLWDADKLSKIGVVGTVHFLCKSISLGGDIIDLEEFFSEEEIPLHLQISSSLNTEYAKSLAHREMAAAAAFRRQMRTVPKLEDYLI